MVQSSRQLVTTGRLFFLVVAFGAGGLVVFLGQPDDPRSQYHDTLHAQHGLFRAAVAAPPLAPATPHESLAAEVWPTRPVHADVHVPTVVASPVKVDVSQLPHSADCGNKPNTLVIGILASPSLRSGQSRDAIRQTWGGQKGYKSTVTVRFLLALDAVSDYIDLFYKKVSISMHHSIDSVHHIVLPN